MYSIAQLPKTDIEGIKIPRNGSNDFDSIVNPEIGQFNYRPVISTDERKEERGRKKKLEGYFDPNFESLEYNRLMFRGNLPRAIDSGVKNKNGYNVLIDSLGEDDYVRNEERNDEIKIGRNRHHRFVLNKQKGNVFDDAHGGINDVKRYRINDTHGSENGAYKHQIIDPNIAIKPLNYPINVKSYSYDFVEIPDIPLYPEIKGFIEREGVDRVDKEYDERMKYWSNEKARMPAGRNFASIDVMGQSEAFTPNSNSEYNICPCLLNEKEKEDIERMKAMNSTERGMKGPVKEGFENPIANEADYMYMNALKVRALAVCQYLKNNKMYKKWSSNWSMLERNLKGGKLFERLSETDADIAYVVDKGREIKFRIRDNDRYVPINTYQYVLYHEMAHMSTKELQHTEFFMKLLNIISLAGFECGFIDFRRLPTSFYMTNGKPILCKSSMKEEVCNGAEWLKAENPGSEAYYNGIIEAVKRA